MNNEPLIVEKVFAAPVEKVWKTLTDKNYIKQWFFDVGEFKPEVGFEFQFIAGKNNVSYLVLCKITEAIKYKKLSYSWRYEGFRGNSQVIFELFPEGTATRLRLTHEGLETFPMRKTDFINGYYVPGWEDMIGSSLKEFIEKKI